jgi:hypothetical protein
MTRFALLAGLEGILLLSLHVLPFRPAVALVCAFVCSSAVFLGVAWQLSRTRISDRTLLALLLFSILVRGSYLWHTPIGSDDFQRYVWDGKVQSHGINPYRYAPNAEELQPLHAGPLPASVNHPDMKSVYFPFVQWSFWLAYQLTGELILGFKAILLLSECATILLVLALLGKLGLPRRLALLYALCPLPIFQFSLDAHLDGLGIPLLAAALLLFAGKGKTWSLFFLSLSISVKPVGLVLLPLWFLRERGVVARLRVLGLTAAVLGLQFLPYSFDVNPLEGLATFTEHWMFNGMAFSVIHAIVANNQTARIACAVLLAGMLILIYRTARHWIDQAHLSVLALLLCSPVVHPWYAAWLAVLVPAARRWSGVLLVSTVSLASVTAARYILTGEWVESPAILVLEYLPVLYFLAAELREARSLRLT